MFHILRRTYVLITLLCVSQLLAADMIQIANHTDQDLFIGMYYVKGNAQRVGSIYKVSANDMLSIERPSRKLFYDRDLFITSDNNLLQNALSKEAQKNVLVKNVGSLKGTHVHIAYDTSDKLQAYNTLEWNTIKPVLEAGLAALEKTKETAVATLAQIAALKSSLREKIISHLIAVKEDVFITQDASIRVGNELAPQEQQFLEKRLPKVKMALESLLGKSLEDSYIPKIALIGSGGGYRAMLSTTGFLSGADQIGLLDAVTYVTALSGSTWAVGCWMATGLPISEFTKDLIMIVAQNKGLASIGPRRAQLIGDILVAKYAFSLPVTLVDFYGGLLANALLQQFGNRRQHVRLSQQQERMRDGDFPLPIYTAIRADKRVSPEWYEFTPFEIGGAWLGLYVPSWAYGRLFNQGRSIATAPEQSLGFLMGTYGSAFAVTFNRMYQEISNSIYLPTTRMIVKQLLKVVGEKRLSRAEVFNFTYGMEQSPIKDLKVIGLADAGIDFNLPYPPVSGERPERMADILIFLDSSSGVMGAPELKKTEQYARARGLKFPIIDYSTVDKKIASIFMDTSDPSTPVVIYMPRIKEQELWNDYKQQAQANDMYVQTIDDFDPEICAREEFCGTFNFSYSEDQSRKLIMQSEFNMRESRQKIIDAINWVIDHKQK